MMSIWRGDLYFVEDYSSETLGESVHHAVYKALQGVDRVSRFRVPRNAYTLAIL